MSFVWKRPEGRLKTPEQCASELLEVALERDLDEFAAVLAVMCVAQESDFWCPWNAADDSSKEYPFDSQSDDGRSVAYFQQQNGRAGEELPVGDRDNWWGPMSSRMNLRKSGNEFLRRLEPNYRDAINSPALASEKISNVQHPREDLRGEYAKHWDRAWQLVRGVPDQPTNGDNTMVSGDPVWLEDVLRPVLGDRLKTLPGWQDAGVGGTMGQIWGVIWHHTGNAGASAQSIRDGRPDLAGPLSQLHMAQDGTVTIVAVGPCNHAGKGSWAGLPTDDANDRTIGIEMAWPRDLSITEATQRREEWPPAMIQSMLDVGAAIAIKLGFKDGSHNISHNEWARFGPAGWRQGKWDPGNLNMSWIRDHISARVQQLEGQPPVPPPIPPPSDRQLLERIAVDVAWIRAQLDIGDPAWDPIHSTERPDVPLTVRDAIDTLIERGN